MDKFCERNRSSCPSPSKSATQREFTGARWAAAGNGFTTKRSPRLSSSTESSVSTETDRATSSASPKSIGRVALENAAKESTRSRTLGKRAAHNPISRSGRSAFSTGSYQLSAKSRPWPEPKSPYHNRRGAAAVVVALPRMLRPQFPRTRSMRPSSSKSPATTAFQSPESRPDAASRVGVHSVSRPESFRKN